MIFLHRRSFAGAFHDRKEVQSLQQRQALGLIRQSLFTWNQHPIVTL